MGLGRRAACRELGQGPAARSVRWICPGLHRTRRASDRVIIVIIEIALSATIASTRSV